jgi:hypothetical protein
LITINLTSRSIGIVGRPNPLADASHAASTGASSAGSANSSSSAAKSAGRSRTSTGSAMSNSDSTCPPDSRSITLQITRFAGRILPIGPDGTASAASTISGGSD